jgi:glycosyltransferase involved in cell wall biosynthesis
MKILIAAASFASNMSGLQRHAINVARCLLPRPEISALHFVVAPWQRGFMDASGLTTHPRLKLHVAEMGRGSLSRNSWYFRRLPELAADAGADLVHLTYPMPVKAGAFHCPTVVTLHDLYPYEIPMNFGFPKYIFNRLVLRQCLRSVDAIACVSDVTKSRLNQYLPSATKKAVRIYNCVEPGRCHSSEPPIPDWHEEPFLLSIAQHRRNKNLHLLIRTYHRLLRAGQIPSNTGLIIVGISGPETGKIEQLVSALGLSRSIHFLEGLSESELQWCYRNCKALVAPSITEGFGLPIAEGLLAGCRIVCSDIPAHREIGDGRCRFVKLKDDPEEALASAIATSLFDPREPRAILPELSAPVLAEQYISFYRRLITTAAPAKNATPSTPIATEEGNLYESNRSPVCVEIRRG